MEANLYIREWKQNKDGTISITTSSGTKVSNLVEDKKDDETTSDPTPVVPAKTVIEDEHYYLSDNSGQFYPSFYAYFTKVFIFEEDGQDVYVESEYDTVYSLETNEPLHLLTSSDDMPDTVELGLLFVGSGRPNRIYRTNLLIEKSN